MKVHHIKTIEPFFTELVNGTKTFEARLNDRDYKAGDEICACKFDPERGFLGPNFTFTAGFILYGPAYGIEEGHCIISVLTSQIMVTGITVLPIGENIEGRV